MSVALPVADRRARLLQLVARASVAAVISAQGWVEMPAISTAARRIGCRPSAVVLRKDLKWLCEAGQLERLVQGDGMPRDRRVWYRLRRVS